MVLIKLKEANGKIYEWSSFHMGLLETYQAGDVIDIEPKLVFKEGNKWPFRNIERVIGKRDASEINTLDVLAQQPGAPAESPGSTNGTYDQGKAIERRSIERQTSLKLVVELFKGGCAADDLESVVEAVIRAAVPLEEHLARQGALLTVKVPDPENYGKFVDKPVNCNPSNGASSTGDKPRALDSYKMETVGDLFTAATDRYKGKTIGDILDALDVKSKEELAVNMTIANAWGILQSLWEGPPAKKAEAEQEEIEV